MNSQRRALIGFAAAFAIGSGLLAAAQAPLPLSPTVRGTGQALYGAYEGWYKNPDGSFTFLVGYFNRNTKQELEIPVGPNNRIEPGNIDQGQPTHFQSRRQFGVFTITVPKDFGTKKLTWTLTANGQTAAINMHLDPNWVVEPFEDAGSKNTPPVLRFQTGGPTFTGPPKGLAASFLALPGDPTELTVYATDAPPKRNLPPVQLTRQAGPPQPPVTITWSKFRGPGDVAFNPARPQVDVKGDGKATTRATFSAPGEYILRVQANDAGGDGGGGFQCCWTNAHVKVTVRAAQPTLTGR